MRTGISINPIENENILENKRSVEKREIMTSLYPGSNKNKEYLKIICIREEKYKMTNTVVYDLAYLIV
jgi:hypothetical protein